MLGSRDCSRVALRGQGLVCRHKLTIPHKPDSMAKKRQIISDSPTQLMIYMHIYIHGYDTLTIRCGGNLPEHGSLAMPKREGEHKNAKAQVHDHT